MSYSIAAVSYQKQVQPILQRTCQGCHNPKDQGDLSLTNYTSFEKGELQALFLLAVALTIVPFLTSSLVISGVPITADPLTVDEISLIRQWILEETIDDTIAKSIQALMEVSNYQNPPVIFLHWHFLQTVRN